jgi:hypothetical protein
VNKSELFEAFVRQVLEHRCSSVHPHLRERLGKAIVQRRRHFAYQQRHQQKIDV